MSAYLEPLLQSGHSGFHPKLPFCGFPTALTLAPVPGPDDVCIFELEPVVVSVLDYTKGFGHTDLVSF